MSVETIKYADICDECMHKGYCDMAQFGGHNPKITACSHFSKAKQTNADRVRQMADKKLAEFLHEITEPTCPPLHTHKYCISGECEKCWLDWLKAPAKEEA